MTATIDDAVSRTAAERVWDNVVIRSAMCENASPEVLVKIARLSRACFDLAIPVLWGRDPIALTEVEDALKKVHHAVSSPGIVCRLCRLVLIGAGQVSHIP